MKIVQFTGLAISLVISGSLLQKSVVAFQAQDSTISMNLALEQKESAFKRDNIIYTDIREEQQLNGSRTKNLVRFLHASKFDGIKMTDVLVVDRSQNKVQRIINAKSGKLSADKKSWDFFNGKVYAIGSNTSKRFKYLKVILGKTPLEMATSDQQKEASQSKQDNITYSETITTYRADGSKIENLARFFYIRKFDGQNMIDPMIINLDRNGIDQLIQADSGKIDREKRLWDFSNGMIYAIDPKSQHSTRSQFEHLLIRLNSAAVDASD